MTRKCGDAKIIGGRMARTKTEPVFLYLSKEQKEHLKQVAREELTTVAQLIRDMIQKDIEERAKNVTRRQDTQ